MNQEAPTKDRILDAAERLFGEHGFDGVSLRTIIAEASVNLAAVHYHFHSKEALLDAVFARRMAPLNRERLARLDACEAEAGGGPVPIEQLLEALLMPVLHLVRDPSRNGPTFCKLMGRLHAETSTHMAEVFTKHMAGFKERLQPALRRSLPELPPAELFWRMHFTMGAVAHTLRGSPVTAVMSGGVIDPSDLESGMHRLIAFLAAGLRAPVAVAETQELENVRS
ncbi:MAG: TetR/AcrR family transcriptional regulator [Candidatus Solibacter usitatus]|nr:TetR/AcrR family transcriptional regulator [Candidatus Solibacter usitatus]